MDILVCDHVEREGARQPVGPVIRPWVCQVNEPPGQAYADFRALYNTWQHGGDDFVGFMGYRKYILFPGFEWVYTEPSHVPTWRNASRQHFDNYRAALSEWDGASILPLLATHDIIVTPPFQLPKLPGESQSTLMDDFAASRSSHDARVLAAALRARNVSPASCQIYPYIFVTRWSVFNRFMEFAWPLAQELEPLCKGADSVNPDYKRRPMAYVLERAFSLWLENSGLSRVELPIVNCWEL